MRSFIEAHSVTVSSSKQIKTMLSSLERRHTQLMMNFYSSELWTWKHDKTNRLEHTKGRTQWTKTMGSLRTRLNIRLSISCRWYFFKFVMFYYAKQSRGTSQMVIAIESLSGGTILESVAKLWSLTKQRFSSLREGLVFLNIWSLLDTGIRDSFVPKENCGSAK